MTGPTINPDGALVTVFPRIDRPGETTTDLALRGVYNVIRSDRGAEDIGAIRTHEDNAERDRLKRSLPLYTPSGTFSRRCNAGLSAHSGVVQLDFDKLASLAAAERLRDYLGTLPGVRGAFVSPSGRGVKLDVEARVIDPETGEVRLPTGDEHGTCYDAVAARFPSDHLDTKGRDVARACFLSHDPGAVWNEHVEPVEVVIGPPEPEPEQADPPARKGHADRVKHGGAPSRERVRSALLSIPSRPDYDDWIRVIAAVLDAVEGDACEAEGLLKEWSPEETEGEYARKLRSPLERVTAGTLFYLAKEQGWKPVPLSAEARADRTDGTPEVGHTKAGHAEPEHRPVLDVRTASEWMDVAAKEPVPLQLWGPLWYEHEATVLYSSTNVGKSVMAVQIADGIARGTGSMGLPCEPGPMRVLYLDFEMSRKQFERRYSRAFSEPYRFHPNFLRAEINPDALADEDHFDTAVRGAIEQAVEANDVRVVVVDNLTFIGRQSQEARDALPLMRALYRMKRKHGLSMLILAHTPKRDRSRPLTRNDLAGSAHVANFVDAMVGLGESAKDASFRYLKQIKQRSTEEVYGADNVLVLTLEKRGSFLGLWPMGTAAEADHLDGPKAAERAGRDGAIVAQREQGRSIREIAADLGISPTTVQKVLRREKPNDGGEGVPPRTPLPTAITSYDKEYKRLAVTAHLTGAEVAHHGDGGSTSTPDLSRLPF
jgi:hypothetical protein